MPTLTATIYRPGRQPDVLDAARRSLLGVTLGKSISAHIRTVAAYLKAHSVDLLYADESCAVYGLENAADYETSLPNPEAEAAVYGLTGEQCELCGPVLLIVSE